MLFQEPNIHLDLESVNQFHESTRSNMKLVGFLSPCSLSISQSHTSTRCATRRTTERRHRTNTQRRTRQLRTKCSAAGYPAPTPGDSAGTLARDIAISFVTACGNTTVPYTIAIRKFVSLALDAYTKGIPLSALRDELRTGEGPQLANDEAELRDVWLALVYKTLRFVRFPGNTNTPSVPDQFDAFVKSIVIARRNGNDLPRIQLEHAVTSGNERSTPLESAILRQSTRLVITTLEEADERREKFQ